MGWLGDLIGAIPVIGKPLVAIGNAIGGISGVIKDALTDTGIASLAATITTVIGGIDNVVTGLSSSIASFISPITGVVDAVAHLGTDIQDKVIGPIVDPIVKTVTEIKGLTDTVGKLVDQGITGILAIPKAISDSLTSVATAFDNSSRILADANQSIASQTLVPGIHEAVAPGLKTIGDHLEGFSNPKAYTVDPYHLVALTQSQRFKGVADKVAEFVEKGKNPTSPWDIPAVIALDLITVVPLIVATLTSQIEEAEADARFINPSTLLGPSDAIQMYRRGVISDATMRDELQHQGYDTSRQDAMLEASQFLPAIQQALDWMNRGLIGAGEFARVVKAYGGTDDDVKVFTQASAPLFSPQILLDWVARGIIDGKAFDDQLRGQGYTDAQIKLVLLGGILPAQVASLISSRGNIVAAGNNWFASTYGSPPPEEIANAGRKARLDEDETALRWAAHWAKMPIQTAISLFFRGEMTRQEVRYVVTQSDYPPEMTDLLITSQSSQILPRSVPALLARGSITELKAREILTAKGYDPADVALLVDDALAVAAVKNKTTQTDTTKLSLSELSNAYRAGIIDEADYRKLLGEHGYSKSDEDVTVALDSYKALADQKKELVATLKAEVALGTKTPADVQQELQLNNFSQGEIERIMASTHQAKRTAARLPSLADMTKMVKLNIIDGPTFLAGIQALGYTDPWDQRLLSLVFTPGVTDGQQPTGA